MTKVSATPLIESAKAPAVGDPISGHPEWWEIMWLGGKITVVPILEADPLGADDSGIDEYCNDKEDGDADNLDSEGKSARCRYESTYGESCNNTTKLTKTARTQSLHMPISQPC